MYILASGTAALVTIVRAERLNAFVRTGVVVGLANVVVLTAFNLLAQRDVAAIFQGMLAGLVNAGLTVLLAVGSFATLGNVFGIMTVFQLLELANPSNRLLRRLLLETPGTYHHAVMVGNLAERAAETIGADPLLARVAAYYHDIGKMRNPLAFIENQAGRAEHPRRARRARRARGSSPATSVTASTSATSTGCRSRSSASSRSTTARAR